MGIRVFNDLVLAQDVELERAVKLRPPICLLWAYLIVHIHDKLFLVTQV
jgi:hypothetical protein